MWITPCKPQAQLGVTQFLSLQPRSGLNCYAKQKKEGVSAAPTHPKNQSNHPNHSSDKIFDEQKDYFRPAPHNFHLTELYFKALDLFFKAPEVLF
jgi:hypothetical protein